MNASVILASYNGEKYIQKQLDSIIRQLDKRDELLISDDGSTDQTLAIVKEYMKKDSRIRLLEGPHQGSAKNFVFAIPKAAGEIILFSDQDDLWCDGKMNRIKQNLEMNPKISLIMHDAEFCNAEDEKIQGSIFERRHPKHGAFHNLMYSAYYGCCMGARKSFLIKYVKPFEKFENNIPFDQYFGFLAEYEKASLFLSEKLIKHRYHGANQSVQTNAKEKVKFRIRLAKCVAKAISQRS